MVIQNKPEAQSFSYATVNSFPNNLQEGDQEQATLGMLPLPPACLQKESRQDFHIYKHSFGVLEQAAVAGDLVSASERIVTKSMKIRRWIHNPNYIAPATDTAVASNQGRMYLLVMTDIPPGVPPIKYLTVTMNNRFTFQYGGH